MRAFVVLKLIINLKKNKKKLVREENVTYMSWFFLLLSFQSALKEHHWKAVEEYDFFSNLEYLLRFLGQNALPEETN